jgi:GDP-L-fucose synthase
MTTENAEYLLAGKRVWVAGHRGMVGSAIARRLARENCDVVTVDRAEVDLRRQADVEDWMAQAQPDAVFLAAATVGGIQANDTRPAEFLYDNLAIETNIIEGARRCGVEKLLFMGSACIYPRLAAQPMVEDALLTGPLEPTNEAYAVAKIAGIKLCSSYRRQYGCDYISAMPNNLYGRGDNFDLQSSHVIPALMRKAHEAKTSGDPTMTVWGSGMPLREFVYVDDLADAAVFLMQRYSGETHLNIGTGEEISIRDLAATIAEAVGYDGELVFDAGKPDGAPRKLLDVSRLSAMGWQPTTRLLDGLRLTYDWYLASENTRGGPG